MNPDNWGGIYHFLARLFSKKTSRYCHSLASSSAAAGILRKLTFSYISVITEDNYLKLRIIVHYQNGNPYQ